MSYLVTHRYGCDERDPPLSSFPALLRELDSHPEDEEPDSVAVRHESEWCISVQRGGHVVFVHLEDGGERHTHHVPESKIVELWSSLAIGDLAKIEREPWSPGYGWRTR